MTDRIHAFTVVLDKDIRDDDIESILLAITCIKHVYSVKPVIADAEDYMARERVKSDVKWRIHDAIDAVFEAPS